MSDQESKRLELVEQEISKVKKPLSIREYMLGGPDDYVVTFYNIEAIGIHQLEKFCEVISIEPTINGDRRLLVILRLRPYTDFYQYAYGPVSPTFKGIVV